MGDDSLHGLRPGDFPEQGGPLPNRKTAAAALVLKLGVPPIGLGDGGGNMGGMFGGGGGVHIEEEEYVCLVLLIMDLCEEVVQRLGMWISKK